MRERMDEESKAALISYRVQRAFETLKEADVMRREGFYKLLLIDCIMLVIMQQSRYYLSIISKLRPIMV